MTVWRLELMRFWATLVAGVTGATGGDLTLRHPQSRHVCMCGVADSMDRLVIGAQACMVWVSRALLCAQLPYGGPVRIWSLPPQH